MDHTEFAGLATDLAAELARLRSEDWTAELAGGDTWATLACGTARVTVTWYAREARLVIYGLDPDGRYLSPYRITVNPARGALAVAKDVSRRILAAGYADDLLAAIAKKAERDALEAQRAALEAQRAAWLDQAAELFGITRPKDHERGADPSKVYLAQFVTGNGYVQNYGWSDEHADMLDINLSGIPAQVALDMLKVLAESDAVRARCCFTYGPDHPPQFSVAGCLYRRSGAGRGEDASRERVWRFLVKSRGIGAGEAYRALDEARASRYQVSEIYDGERGPGARLLAIVSWDHEGCGEYTVQVPREAS
jgi:hypothetical protein